MHVAYINEREGKVFCPSTDTFEMYFLAFSITLFYYSKTHS